MKILLIEDDSLLSSGLKKALEQQMYVCDAITSVREASNCMLEDYELVILDLGLPDGDGLSLLRTWRKEGNKIPVLILTARDAVEDRVKGLDAGADDYLVKPFALAELTARVRALMRRRFDQTENLLEIDEFKLDLNHHQAWFQEQELILTRMEFAILRRLLLHPGKTVNRERLQQDLYDWESDTSSNTLEVHIHHLRKKIGTERIKTVRGEGYRLEIQPK